jgi:hypothetical protein
VRKTIYRHILLSTNCYECNKRSIRSRFRLRDYPLHWMQWYSVFVHSLKLWALRVRPMFYFNNQNNSGRSTMVPVAGGSSMMVWNGTWRLDGLQRLVTRGYLPYLPAYTRPQQHLLANLLRQSRSRETLTNQVLGVSDLYYFSKHIWHSRITKTNVRSSPTFSPHWLLKVCTSWNANIR